YQFIHKPWHPDSLLLSVRGAAQRYQLQRDNQLLTVELRATEPVLRGRVEAKREALLKKNAHDGIARAKDSPMNALCAVVHKVARYDIPVLLTGESGTGKELLARAIHYHSSRAGRAFVVENCAALPEQLLESELFGHKRGSFTGAYEDRIGLFQQADGGTIFLDEIGDTSPGFQVKMLRVLQEGEIRPVGSARPLKINVRVISATNADLQEAVRTGRFRADLYYRLSAFSLVLPSLRERPMDIPLIATQLLADVGKALRKPVAGFSREALDCLCRYHWPGNVRQLQNEIYRMVALTESETLSADLLSAAIVRGADLDDEPELEHLSRLNGSLKDRLETLESRLIREVMVRHRWNKTKAAEELGLSRVGLRGKLLRYGMEKAERQ
ncbi:partial Hydrogenase transcriptional regulatory protein hupR1, partial [Burkholderiales bacterium]